MAVTFKFDDNGYGQIISIRYYAEKRLKSRPFVNKDGSIVDTFPLYIQIHAKRETFQRKSITGAYVDPESIEDYLHQNVQLITDETNAIYTRIKMSPAFSDGHFKLKHALENYSVLDEDVCHKIGELLYDDYCAAYLTDLRDRLQTQLFLSVPNLDPALLEPNFRDTKIAAHIEMTDRFQAYRNYVSKILPRNVFGEVFDKAVSNNKHVLQLQERYGIHFWNLDNYCQALKSQCGYPIISIAYFLSDGFKGEFIKNWGIDRYTSINQSFNLLRTDKSELDSMLKQMKK